MSYPYRASPDKQAVFQHKLRRAYCREGAQGCQRPFEKRRVFFGILGLYARPELNRNNAR